MGSSGNRRYCGAGPDCACAFKHQQVPSMNLGHACLVGVCTTKGSGRVLQCTPDSRCLPGVRQAWHVH